MLEGLRRARARETSWRWPWERFDPGVCYSHVHKAELGRNGLGWCEMWRGPVKERAEEAKIGRAARERMKPGSREDEKENM